MSYTELFNKVSRPWCSVKEIMAIANCCKEIATHIRDNIIKTIRLENKDVPCTKRKVVPTKRVLEYLDLDIDYIKNMALKEQEITKAILNKDKSNANIPR